MKTHCNTRLRRLIVLACACLLVPAFASAQPVVQPSAVAFTPSADHALLTGYEMGLFATGASAPTSSVVKTLAQLTPSGADFTFAFPRLLFGTWDVKLRACAAAVCSAWAAADRQAQINPFPPTVPRVIP